MHPPRATRYFFALLCLAWLGQILPAPSADLRKTSSHKPLCTYLLATDATWAAYDEALAVATIQGILNRRTPELYILSRTNNRPQFWLNLLSKESRWLEGREQKPLTNLDALVKFAGKNLKGIVIWDPAVPATVNVATTIAGVRDAVALSPEFAECFRARWRLPVLTDLRGKFTGAETGSAKNDAYRWAIREYLAKGRCSAHLLCLFEDSFTNRAAGDVSYIVTRDWAVKNRAFVFDLSPWPDEKPADDPGQRLGLDAETYQLILAETLRQSAGKQMTEMTGFAAMEKYSHTAKHASTHEGVPTEWETVWQISPFNCYQNTISSDCYNQSFHSHAPRQPLKQHSVARTQPLEKKNYVCFLMADYDSSTPLYDFLPKHWQDPHRGQTPLAWGINPNQLENYPDLFAYYYSTATTNDTFTSDASAAGYMNPNRIRPEYLPLFVKHNQKFFREADMTIAPMVLDRDQPTSAVKDAFQQFAPDGYATIVNDVLGRRGNFPAPQVWKGMPIMELLNDTCASWDPPQIADVVANAIHSHGNKLPGFYFFRVVWLNPSAITDTMTALRRSHPELNCEVVDPRTFFALFKKNQQDSTADDHK